MTLLSIATVDCNHNKYTFKHRIKGTNHVFDIVAFNIERANDKAWTYVKQQYQKLKQK